MPLFDAENRLRTDGCATDLYFKDLQKYASYYMFNRDDDKACGSSKDRMKEFASQHRNLQPWDGFGLDRGLCDVDSAFRYAADGITHAKCRQQLPNRLFQAVPQLQRGVVLPGLESRLLSGADTSRIRQCDRVSEKDNDKIFHPYVSNVVEPTGARIGLRSSRDIARSREFLEGIGYMHDGRAWRRTTG